MTNSDEVRRVLLEVIAESAEGPEKHFGRWHVLRETANRVVGAHMRDEQSHQRILDAWDDLYRQGIVSWGRNLDSQNNATADSAHLTQHGLASTKDLSRDPSNPAAYRAAIQPHVRDVPVVISYLDEAVDTYNRGSFKSSAVMVGGAAESLALVVRDRLSERITKDGEAPSQALQADFPIAGVIRAVGKELDARKTTMPQKLRERFESHWIGFTGLYRMTRNDAGHPTSVEPVTREAVHANLLLFHEHARLCRELIDWMS